MEKYLVVIEKAKTNYSAFSLDFWGCVATGKTVEETVLQIKEALQIHLESVVNVGKKFQKRKGLVSIFQTGYLKKVKLLMNTL